MNNLEKYLEQIVYGGNDGIITTFAVVAGFNGAQLNQNEMLSLSFATVLLFGLANLFADALSMGLGSYLSVRSGQDVSESKSNEYKHMLQQNPEHLKRLTAVELEKQGFDKTSVDKQIEVFDQNPSYWFNFLISAQGLDNPERVKPALIGLVTFVSFSVFGVVPLLPYILNMDIRFAFATSVGLTIAAMLCLAVVRAKVSKTTHVFQAIRENMLVGGLAAVIAFLVGTMFS